MIEQILANPDEYRAEAKKAPRPQFQSSRRARRARHGSRRRAWRKAPPRRCRRSSRAANPGTGDASRSSSGNVSGKAVFTDEEVTRTPAAIEENRPRCGPRIVIGSSTLRPVTGFTTSEQRRKRRRIPPAGKSRCPAVILRRGPCRSTFLRRCRSPIRHAFGTDETVPAFAPNRLTLRYGGGCFAHSAGGRAIDESRHSCSRYGIQTRRARGGQAEIARRHRRHHTARTFVDEPERRRRSGTSSSSRDSAVISSPSSSGIATRDMRIAYAENPEFDRTGNMYSLSCARHLLDTDCMILEADLLYKEDAIPRLLADLEAGRDSRRCTTASWRRRAHPYEQRRLSRGSRARYSNVRTKRSACCSESRSSPTDIHVEAVRARAGRVRPGRDERSLRGDDSAHGP